MTDTIVVGQAPFKNLQEGIPVLVIEKDRLSVVAQGGQVVERTGKFDAERSGLAENIAEKT